MLRHLGRHLGIPHPLIAVEVLQYLDRGSHVRGELKYAHPLGNPHRHVSVPKGVGDRFSCRRDFLQGLWKPPLKDPIV
jgi:hypothetical protein